MVVLSTSLGYCQETAVISGRIYSLEKELKDIKIINLNKNTFSYSNANGLFTIGAEPNDSIKFTSLFYQQKVIVVQKKHFKSAIEVVLIDKIFELEEVVVAKEYAVPDFDKEEYTVDFQKQIDTDRKKSPFKYGVLPNDGGNISNLIRLVVWVFKDKKKNKDEETEKTIIFDELTHLFKNDSFFSEEVLINDLKIPKDQKEIFFMYCEAQNINSELLEPDHKFELFDQLMNCSKGFLSRADRPK